MTTTTTTTLDDRDLAIARERHAAYVRRVGPQVGDFVDFAGAVQRRISHVWPADWHDDNIARIQTSDSGGRFYLDTGGVSFSGGLYGSIPANTLEQTGGKLGRFWFFHHNEHRAFNGVDIELAVRVWACPMKAPR